MLNWGTDEVVGHMPCLSLNISLSHTHPVSEMTYTVSSGTLNPSILTYSHTQMLKTVIDCDLYQVCGLPVPPTHFCTACTQCVSGDHFLNLNFNVCSIVIVLVTLQ